MIAYLKGTVAAVDAESAVIDVGGVGYLVYMPESHLHALVVDEPSQVHVHTYVREDQLTLYGFVDAVSRQAFGKLIQLNKVGPRLALSILGTFDLAGLRDVALRADVTRLKRVPGVGTKMAERLALELKDVVDGLEVGGASPLAGAVGAGRGAARPSVLSAAPRGVWDEARSALVNLGFAEQDSEAALALVRDEEPETDHLDTIIRRALARLRRR